MGFNGIKTGVTNCAGACMAARFYMDIKGKIEKVVIVILGSKNISYFFLFVIIIIKINLNFDYLLVIFN